jgi:colicin import membrane protein
MSTEIVKVNPVEFGLDEKKAVEITSGLTQILEERKTLTEMYSEVINLEITKENLDKFRELRLKIRDNRTKGIEKWHKSNKEFWLRGGQFVDAIKNKEIAENERMENNLMENEKFFERLEAKRIEELKIQRAELCQLYSEFIPLSVDLGTLSDEDFNNLLNGAKLQYNAKIEQLKKEEEARIENERLNKLEQDRRFELAPYTQFITDSPKLREMEEKEYQTLFNSLVDAKNSYEKKQEQIRVENERLKKEAEEKEKSRLAELQIEKDKQAKLEAELKAKKDAEIKAENERLQAEKTAKLEAEKLAKAPVKNQLQKWVDSFGLPNKTVENNVSKDIEEKFEAFKKWAKTQIENL